MDGKDGHGLKLEKVGPTKKCYVCKSKPTKNILWLELASDETLQEHFVYEF